MWYIFDIFKKPLKISTIFSKLPSILSIYTYKIIKQLVILFLDGSNSPDLAIKLILTVLECSKVKFFASGSPKFFRLSLRIDYLSNYHDIIIILSYITK